MKTITFTFTNEITNYRKRSETKVKREATITFDNETRFSQIAEFLRDVKTIWKECTKPYGESYEYRQLEVTESVYDTERHESISFDRWATRNNDDITTDGDERGVYLVPDERYTESNRDMFIGKNVYADITFTLG